MKNLLVLFLVLFGLWTSVFIGFIFGFWFFFFSVLVFKTENLTAKTEKSIFWFFLFFLILCFLGGSLSWFFFKQTLYLLLWMVFGVLMFLVFNFSNSTFCLNLNLKNELIFEKFILLHPLDCSFFHESPDWIELDPILNKKPEWEIIWGFESEEDQEDIPAELNFLTWNELNENLLTLEKKHLSKTFDVFLSPSGFFI